MPWSTHRAPRLSLCRGERLFRSRRNRQALWITACGISRRAARRPTQQCDKPTMSSRDFEISSSLDMTNPLMPIDDWGVVRSDLRRIRPDGLVRAIPSISGSPYGVRARVYSFFIKYVCCRNTRCGGPSVQSSSGTYQPHHSHLSITSILTAEKPRHHPCSGPPH